MNSKPQAARRDRELERFARRFFEIQGALLETTARGAEVVMPPKLSGPLGTPEYIRLNFESSPAPDTGSVNEFAVYYGSPLLEKMVHAVCGQMPLLACELEFQYLKSQGFERLIGAQFTFNGAVGRVDSWATVKTEYLYLTCRYIAQSDEQKEGLVDLIFNLENGAYVPDMAPNLAFVARNYRMEGKTAGWDAKKINLVMGWVKNQSPPAIQAAITSFQESMNRRFRRDVANLQEYYDDLQKEMEASLKRPGLSAPLIRDRQEKIALLPAELAQKKDDLFKKYSIRVKVRLCTALRITTPAVKVLYQARVGRQSKNLALMYNPVNKSMDPLVCQGCGASVTNIFFCRHVHLLCETCYQACPACRSAS
ncbi:MAG: hypothetical protein JSW39_28745 [Desulfobacterales bacterium]|nr:MAG: hypothetical protein JSW39_28745 [Desulfobacterales bacterium]